ncbi:MAG: nitrogen fixation protein NifQ [Gammaproteobacteria bacterium]|nr:nitrogen fixation protein NifQ [Gammaproteobacteria bacterium]
MNMLARVELDPVEEACRTIMAYASGLPDDETYACMLSSWQAGDGVLPADFALGEDGFSQLLVTYFPGMDKASLDIPLRSNDVQRDAERAEVFQLLFSHRANLYESEIWMA